MLWLEAYAPAGARLGGGWGELDKPFPQQMKMIQRLPSTVHSQLHGN